MTLGQEVSTRLAESLGRIKWLGILRVFFGFLIIGVVIYLFKRLTPEPKQTVEQMIEESSEEVK